METTHRQQYHLPDSCTWVWIAILEVVIQTQTLEPSYVNIYLYSASKKTVPGNIFGMLIVSRPIRREIKPQQKTQIIKIMVFFLF